MTARSRRGLFVTFEGIEGSGKSTQLRILARRLRRLGVPLLVTRQPAARRLGLASGGSSSTPGSSTRGPSSS